ncbi:ketosteroid isomerase-like protein [Paenarthrobacter nitroguajacolicus]|uniref:nuclear transport factor 2 family protein n=1 Tax=Paenarthrobacter TaxID=1742992 RepID=UPI0028602EEC|nr:nuclear transport factor 2 family protein [Paenarthrobacter nitroguajacolicus]MDR6989908.1 ketosteroid isomerase-like protein [Paenarthrobacter nitroguajacolicus]
MPGKETTGVGIAVAYHRAWTAGDLDSAAKHLTENVTCHAPSGTFSGRAAVRAFMEPFAASLTHSTLLAAYGNDSEAILMYDTATSAVPSAPGAELYRIQNDRIAEIHIIFDRLPFALARGDVG